MIREDHKEISSGKKKDDEGYMARNELDSIERSIKNLRKQIKSGNQQLPAWVQSKITKAADYIDTASEYLQSDESIDENTKSNRIPRTKILTSTGSQIAPRTGAKALGPEAAKALGPKAEKLRQREVSKVSLPPKFNKEEVSLVEKILGEEKCGKGMYWCKTDKVCKPLSKKMMEESSCNHTKKGKYCPVHNKESCPMGEEKDPKGPVQPYKSPKEIAQKHGVSLDIIKNQLEMGIKVELEHTSNRKDARITALQHLDEVPNYYSKLKKVESKNESNIVRDCDGNVYAEFIDLIKPGSIEEENPCWKGYTQVGMKMKNGKEVPNCVPVKKGVKKAKGYKKKNVSESVRLQAQNGNIISVVISWRGKYYSMRLFFPQVRMPNRKEVTAEVQKVYPGSRVVTYNTADLDPNQPLVQVQNSKSKNYLMNNNTIGEGVEIKEEKKK
jgi:hypothetical protein